MSTLREPGVMKDLEVTGVYCQYGALTTDVPVEDTAVLIIRTPNAICEISGSNRLLEPGGELEAWARHRITVNAISPTFVRTPQVASLLADEEFHSRLVARIPLGRIAEPEELAGAILLFCADASSFVTGQVLTLDGGLTAAQ